MGPLTPQQRRVVLALTGVVAAMLLVVAILVLTGDDGPGTPVAADGATTTTAREATTTTGAGAEPGPAATTTSAAPTTTVAAPGDGAPIVDGGGAVLAAPDQPDVRQKAKSCTSFGHGPAYEIRCGELDAGGARLAWVTERNRATGGLRAAVLRRMNGPDYVTMLAIDDDAATGASTYSEIGVRVEDVSGDGEPEIVFGFRVLGTGSVLAVDLVSSPGVVSVHQDLQKGAARASAGRLDTWSARFGPGDANCCPSAYLRRTIRFADGAWRVVGREEVAPDTVPASQL